MDSITVKNFRCFGEEQTARLAPLTLLVGDNSTGKTSFLSLIRALWDVAYREMAPDFKEPPYDLGSYSDIVLHQGRRSAKPRSIEAGFTNTQKVTATDRTRRTDETHSAFKVIFGNRAGSPYPIFRKLQQDGVWIEYREYPNQKTPTVEYGIAEVRQKSEVNEWYAPSGRRIYPLDVAFIGAEMIRTGGDFSRLMTAVQEMLLQFGKRERTPSGLGQASIFASAPIRTEPSRNYDPLPAVSDPEGKTAPSYLARMSYDGGHAWDEMKKRIVAFGRNSGLFDEFNVKRLGTSEGSPFQIQIRKRGQRRIGPFRNLVDVGYGVSQVLPILTELLRPDGSDTFLLQQPEVHLHPSAQAALGTLLCSQAAYGKQVIVETHSDHLIDRVRMDVRDRATKLRPEDVSILFFERVDLEVTIHSIAIDEWGRINGSPPGYRKFFMDEVNRSIGLRRVLD